MLRYLAKTFSVAITVAFAITAATWPIRADMVDGAMVIARNILPPNVVTGNYTIQTPDCFRPAVIANPPTGTQFTITLPPAANVPVGCIIRFNNADTTRGKKLSGFPSGWFPVLFPTQGGGVVSTGQAWATITSPGRWINPSGQTTWHVDLGGSDANDCLASGTTNACATAQAADTRAVYYSDNQGTTPIIAMACSQTHTSRLVMGGIPLGTQLVQLSPDGNCSFNWFVSGANAPITIGDLAELDLNLTFYGGSGSMSCNGNTSNVTNSSGCIYMHGPSPVLDMEGTPTWFPGGNNDNGIYCDSFCQPIMANGLTQGAGGGDNVIYMSAGGKMTQSGTITGSASASINRVYRIFGNATLIMTTANANATTWTAGNPGASLVYGSSVFVNNGLTPAGNITIGASSVNCSSLTAAC